MKPTNSTVGQGLAPAVSNQEIFKNGYGSRGSAPAVKKVFSLFLSIVMLVSVMTGMTITSQAAYDTIGTAKRIQYGITYSGVVIPKTDMKDFYEFYVPDAGNISFTATLKNDDYLNSVSHFYGNFYIYDIDGETIEHYSENSNDALGYVKLSDSIYMSKGTYYFCIYSSWGSYNPGGEYTLKIDYKPNISKPSTLKVSSRSTSALKLSWNKVSGVSGYQLQRKSGDSWKTVANTTSTSYTVKSLKAGTTYNFRVRAYKTINGTKYYSGWRTLKTPTSPSKPAIKTPSTNKKHQITAKWKKVSACSGYQVQYSTSSKFKKSTTKTVSGASKTSCTAKFKKGKKYYIRVRSYKTVDGKKYYSAWSSVKSIKCK